MRWRWGEYARVGMCLGLASCGGGGSPSGSGGSGGNSSSDAGPADTRAGGSGGTDGAPSSEGGALVTATEVCRAAIRAQCERDVVCTGDAMSLCMRFANACPDYYFNTDSNRTVDGIASCLPALLARTCTDYVLGLFPACFVAGKRPDGAGCAFSSQCHSGACGSAGACGICGPGGVAILGPTVVHAAQGQPCDLGAAPVVGCAGDLICAPAQTGSTAGTCVPPPGDGQPCATAGFSSMVCAMGTSCTSPTGGTCVAAGSCGGGVVCGANSYCKPVDGGFTCTPRAAIGQPCADPATAALPPCLAPALCYYAFGKCMVPRGPAEACDDNNPCDSFLGCVNGTCRALGPASCPADAGA